MTAAATAASTTAVITGIFLTARYSSLSGDTLVWPLALFRALPTAGGATGQGLSAIMGDPFQQM
jgi:hypothetical protein